MYKYNVIYADPPWPIKKSLRKSRPNQVLMDYPIMSLEEIEILPVHKISDINSVLFLWTIQSYLPASFSVIEKWGFRYFKTITWDKQNGMCMFGFHNRTEFLIFGYRGNFDAFPKRKAFPTIVVAKSCKHSEKPQIFRDLIVPFGDKRIELFARQKTEGWDVWGNEVDSVTTDLFGG